MIKDTIFADVATALDILDIEPKSFSVEIPANAEFGDYSTNAAMVHSKQAGKDAKTLAQNIAEILSKKRAYKKVETKGGFVNFVLSPRLFHNALEQISKCKSKFGKSDFGKNKRVLVEFVSANPTGPLNIVSARAAAFGDTLAAVMRHVGFRVTKEFYINDFGNQVDILSESIDMRFKEIFGEFLKEFPIEAYRGDYIKDIAKKINNIEGSKIISLSEKDRLNRIKILALQEIFKMQKESLDNFGVRFDSWVSEKNLREKNMIEETLSYLTEADCTYEKDEAIYFKSTRYGDEKDRILMKSDGNTTYFVPDIGYHISKFQRGYDIIVDVLGPDHHGYIPRLKAAIVALKYDIKKLHFIILQQVNIFEDETQIKMSKREGKIVLMDSLVEEVGKDAARFFFLSRKNSSHLNFDLQLAKSKSKENPIYYCQYANARINSIFKQARKEKISLRSFNKKLLSKLNKNSELELIKKMVQFPDTLTKIASTFETHLLTNYTYELASIFHKYYTDYRIVNPSAKELSCARLFLLKSVKQLFEIAFNLMGIEPMEKM